MGRCGLDGLPPASTGEGTGPGRPRLEPGADLVKHLHHSQRLAQFGAQGIAPVIKIAGDNHRLVIRGGQIHRVDPAPPQRRTRLSSEQAEVNHACAPRPFGVSTMECRMPRASRRRGRRCRYWSTLGSGSGQPARWWWPWSYCRIQSVHGLVRIHPRRIHAACSCGQWRWPWCLLEARRNAVVLALPLPAGRSDRPQEGHNRLLEGVHPRLAAVGHALVDVIGGNTNLHAELLGAKQILLWFNLCGKS